jgi:pimeloyl-ACP methyl ester carboxylesterase
MNTTALKMAGGFFNMVGAVSPEAAGRLAFRLFARTRSPEPSTKKERDLFESARGRMSEAVSSPIAVNGGQAVLHRFAPIGEPNGRRVLFTHGWGSRIAFAQGLITGLRQTGTEVYGIDLPGHGDAPGRRLHAAMAIEAIANSYRQFGPFDTMIGHSFGGYMTVLAAHGALDDKPLAPDRLVLVAAPGDVRIVLGFYARMLGLKPAVAAALIDQIRRVTGRPAEAAFGPGFLKQGRLPTLVLHAEEDKEVGAKAARAYAEAGPHVTLQWLNGLGHRRIINSPETLAAIRNFAGL